MGKISRPGPVKLDGDFYQKPWPGCCTMPTSRCSPAEGTGPRSNGPLVGRFVGRKR